MVLERWCLVCRNTCEERKKQPIPHSPISLVSAHIAPLILFPYFFFNLIIALMLPQSHSIGSYIKSEEHLTFFCRRLATRGEILSLLLASIYYKLDQM